MAETNSAIWHATHWTIWQKQIDIWWPYVAGATDLVVFHMVHHMASLSLAHDALTVGTKLCYCRVEGESCADCRMDELDNIKGSVP